MQSQQQERLLSVEESDLERETKQQERKKQNRGVFQTSLKSNLTSLKKHRTNEEKRKIEMKEKRKGGGEGGEANKSKAARKHSVHEIKDQVYSTWKIPNLHECTQRMNSVT